MNPFRRLNDWLRERRIRKLADLVNDAMANRESHIARFHWKRMVKEIELRSPQQIARMNRGLARYLERRSDA